MKIALRTAALCVAALGPGTGSAETPLSGIDTRHFDATVRPQDDFYRYVNGLWLKNTKIPAEKSNYGAFTELHDNAQLQLRAIIEQAAAAAQPPGSDLQKVGDLYRSFMDSDTVEKRGLAPLDAELLRIEQLAEAADLGRLVARHFRIGARTLFSGYVYQDARNPDSYIVYLNQAGLGLPDRDYYLRDEDNFRKARAAYIDYIGTVLRGAGTIGAERVAADILALETRLAEHHWTKVESRDAEKTYNRHTVADTDALLPGMSRILTAAGLPAGGAVVLRQPSYFQALAGIFEDTDPALWREYLRFHLIDSHAPWLSKRWVDAHFEFHGRALSGKEVLKPRWKRGVETVEHALGEVLGRVYVSRHFPPEAKQRMEQLVANLTAAYHDSIENLDWMSAQTRRQALEKLSRFRTKIGYPARWKDYSALQIRADDLLGNVMRSRETEHARELAKLGGPIDREEWFMTPQTVNAYYSPVGNEIVFPAAILQPPFFNVAADDAVNYGAIGAVIGHEIGHGFDDQGSRYDGDGNLRNWWTEADRARFDARAAKLIAQYSAYSPVEGFNVNGELTVGENIGDLGGLSIAYKAWRTSLGGGVAPVIDGLTGAQRFFMGWAQAWRRLYRPDELIKRLKVDPHAPSEYRCNGVLANLPAFHQAFGVKPGDGMYRGPEDQVAIW